MNTRKSQVSYASNSYKQSFRANTGTHFGNDVVISNKKNGGCGMVVLAGLVLSAGLLFLGVKSAYAMACDKCDEGGRYNMPVSAEISKDNDTESNTLTVNVPNDTHIIIDDPAIPDNNTDTSTDEQVNTGTDNSNDDNHPEVHNNNGHGNNVDGVDSSNPGHGPKNEDGNDPSAPIDDESTHNNGHNH